MAEAGVRHGERAMSALSVLSALCLDGFITSLERCESHVARVTLVNHAVRVRDLHDNLRDTHIARCNAHNSRMHDNSELHHAVAHEIEPSGYGTIKPQSTSARW